MTNIILISVLMFIWPVLNILVIGPKKFMYVLGITLFSFFVTTNTLNSFYASTTTVLILLVLNIMISFGVSVYLFIKQDKKIHKDSFKKNFKWIYTFIIIFLVSLLFRIFINHMNSDTIKYAWISKTISQGNFLEENIKVYYRIPTFYHFGSLFSSHANYHTIFGEVSQMVLFALGVNYVLQEHKNKSFLLLTIFAVLLGITTVYGVSFKTSSVNWSVGAITMIFLLANRHDLKSLLMVPVAFANFSFSAMLFMPLVILFFIFRKGSQLREIILTFFTISLFGIVMIITMANISYKSFAIIWIIVPIWVLWYKFPDKFINMIENPLYKIKWLKSVKNHKEFKKIAFWVIFIFVLITEVLMILYWTKAITFPLLINNKVGTILITMPIVLFIMAVYWVDMDECPGELKIMLFMTITMVVYFILQLIPFVPNYLADRISLPLTAISPILAILCIYKWINKKDIEKIQFGKIGTGVLATSTSCLMMWGNTTPAVFWSPFTANIETNYKFLTSDEERMEHYIQKDDVVYSDVALSVIDNIKQKNLYFTTNNRQPFYSEMRIRMCSFTLGVKKQMAQYYLLRSKYKNNTTKFKEELGKLIENGFDKRIINYSPLANSVDVLKINANWWKRWDQENVYKTNYKNSKKINVFAFRNKEYAKIIEEHYSKLGFNLKTEFKHGMHIVRLI